MRGVRVVLALCALVAPSEGKAKGWTIVSMKGDWKTVFPK